MFLYRETTFSCQKCIRRKQRAWYNVYRSADKTNEYLHLYALHGNDRLPLAICCG